MSILQVFYTWPNGKKELRYERPEGSEMADELRREVAELEKKAAERGEVCPYSIGIVEK